MKKLIILILTVITLSSCEKAISGDIVFNVKNTITTNSEGPVATGITIEYLDNGEIIKEYCEYVGRTYSIPSESGNRLYIKGTADGNNPVSITVWYEDQELYSAVKMKEVVIDVTL